MIQKINGNSRADVRNGRGDDGGNDACGNIRGSDGGVNCSKCGNGSSGGGGCGGGRPYGVVAISSNKYNSGSNR